MGKGYFRISELADEVNKKYDEGISKGEDVGFKCLQDKYSVKLGCTTYVYGSPVSGKSEFWFEVLINLSRSKNMVHAIYSPETGNPSDIAIELMHKWVGKPFYTNLDRQQKVNRLTKQDVYRLTAELDQYFVIIDAGEYDFTIEQFYNKVDEIETELGMRIHTTMADPFNEFKHDLQGEARDMYVEAVLGRVRRNARNTQRHNCILTHVQDQQLQQTTGANGETIFYYPMPTPRQIAYGQAWFRKGDAMIALWRPAKGMPDVENNRIYDGNEVIVAVQKAKPKGIGSVGLTRLWFDVDKSCYYEMHNTFDTMFKSYAFEQYERDKTMDQERERLLNSKVTQSELKPSTQFDSPPPF